MLENFSHLDGEDKLKAENDFLKMKLMLEHGAKFSSDENKDMPAGIENEFLNNIAAFEKQFEEHKTIKVFDKIGRPDNFKPVNMISDDQINDAWNELSDYLNKYGIDLGVCSPNISIRELYRFTMEELFEHEMDDMDLPGWTTNFIYDEFHPDPVYDNTKAATDDCINYILQKEPMEWAHHFRKDNLKLNEHYPINEEQLKSIVSNFKSAYDDLEIIEVTCNHCSVNNKESSVDGIYSVNAIVGVEEYLLKGNWQVDFEKDDDFGYWYINNVQIKGILL